MLLSRKNLVSHTWQQCEPAFILSNLMSDITQDATRGHCRPPFFLRSYSGEGQSDFQIDFSAPRFEIEETFRNGCCGVWLWNSSFSCNKCNSGSRPERVRAIQQKNQNIFIIKKEHLCDIVVKVTLRPSICWMMESCSLPSVLSSFLEPPLHYWRLCPTRHRGINEQLSFFFLASKAALSQSLFLSLLSAKLLHFSAVLSGQVCQREREAFPLLV